MSSTVKQQLGRLIAIQENALIILREKHKEMHNDLATLKGLVGQKGREIHNKLIGTNNYCLNGFISVLPN